VCLRTGRARPAIEPRMTYDGDETPAVLIFIASALLDAVSHGGACTRCERHWRNCIASSGSMPAREPRPLVELHDLCGNDAAAELKATCGAPVADRRIARMHGAGARAALPISCGAAALLPALRPLWTHNDLHASTCCGAMRERSRRGIITWAADRTNAVHDLAHAIERNVWMAGAGRKFFVREEVPVHFSHCARC